MLSPNKIRTLIEKHKTFFDAKEKTEFEESRSFYRGDFLEVEGHSAGASDATISKARFLSKNLIYAICDTAVTGLLGSNPQVAPVPNNPAGRSQMPALAGLMSWVFRANHIRRKSNTALIDAVLCKRGIYKTSWDSALGQPLITTVDPSALFFDLSVRDMSQIGYWIEAVPVPWSKFREMVKNGDYDIPGDMDIRPDKYPSWLASAGMRADAKEVRDAKGYVLVWEYYDVDRGCVTHMLDNENHVLLEDEMLYQPYTMFSLNQSGVDCMGMSEVSILRDQQASVNHLLTHWKRVVYLQVPKILYNKAYIKEDDLAQAVNASTGSFCGVAMTGDEGGTPLAAFRDAFYALPMAEVPTGTKELLARIEDDMAFVSALAEASRGRVTGARTATEMAIIDAYNRTRLATREAAVAEAHEDIARKALFLCSRYLPQDRLVRIAGGREFQLVGLDTLRDVDVDWEMVSYNPLRKNPAVILETLVQLLPVISQAPNVDILTLIEVLVDQMGLPPEILKDSGPIRAKIAAEEQAMAAQVAQAQAVQAAPADPAMVAMDKMGGGAAKLAELQVMLGAAGRAASSGGSPAGPEAVAATPAPGQAVPMPRAGMVGRPPEVAVAG